MTQIRRKLRVPGPGDFQPGELHRRAKLTDLQVRVLREMAAEMVAAGHKPMVVYAWLAQKFDIHVRTVKKLVYRERRDDEP